MNQGSLGQVISWLNTLGDYQHAASPSGSSKVVQERDSKS